MTQEFARRIREWAEAARAPQEADCVHEVLVYTNGVLTCTSCQGRRWIG